MKYTLHELDNNGQEIFCVFEEETQQVIVAFETKDEAVRVNAFLNNGGGFDGFTPSFMLNEYVLEETEDINDAFEKEFI